MAHYTIFEQNNGNQINTHNLGAVSLEVAVEYFDSVCENMATEVFLYSDTSSKPIKYREQLG